MGRVEFAALVGACTAVSVTSFAAWKAGHWLGDFTYRRWNNRRLTVG